MNSNKLFINTLQWHNFLLHSEAAAGHATALIKRAPLTSHIIGISKGKSGERKP